MNLFLIVFFVCYLVFYNLIKLAILIRDYRRQRAFFAALENEAVQLCKDGLPDLVFGKVWASS